VNLTLLDTPHLDNCAGFRKPHFRGAEAAIVALNLHDRSSRDSLAPCIAEFREVAAPGPCIVLAGTKADGELEEGVLEETEAIGRQSDMRVFITSSGTGQGVPELLRGLCEMLIAREGKLYRFELLWRGSRDGFRARDFHQRCDGHANTIALIRDSNGNIFGGFTPLPWESPFFAKAKEDPTNQTFVFTLTNPGNCPATIFAQLHPLSAIRVDRKRGPSFGDGVLMISDECTTQNSDSGNIDVSFHNDTGLDGATLLTGSSTFLVSEIEVFEVHPKS
jgi:hypothetical protein